MRRGQALLVDRMPSTASFSSGAGTSLIYIYSRQAEYRPGQALGLPRVESSPPSQYQQHGAPTTEATHRRIRSTSRCRQRLGRPGSPSTAGGARSQSRRARQAPSCVSGLQALLDLSAVRRALPILRSETIELQALILHHPAVLRSAMGRWRCRSSARRPSVARSRPLRSRW